MSVCKICLCSDPENYLSRLKCSENVNQSGEYILLFCLGIQVNQGLGNSIKICEGCFAKLIEFHQFKSLALKNEAILSSLGLQKYLENDIKSEILSHASDDTIYDEPLIDYSALQDQLPIEISTNVRKCGNRSADLEIQMEQSIEVTLKQELSENETISKKKSSKKKSSTKKKKWNGKLFPCNICEKEFKTKFTFDMHQMTHEPIDQRKMLQCAHCNKTFLRKRSLEFHIVKEHPATVSAAVRSDCYKIYQCDLCEESYHYQKHLDNHITNTHKGKPLCPICHKHFAENYIKTHIQVKHSAPDTLKFKCETCGRCFARKAMLSKHVSIHTGVKPFACDICGAKFRLNYSVRLHKAQVHEKSKNHICHICSKRYFSASLLQRHIRNHINPGQPGTVKREGIKKVECPDCGKPLANVKSLKRHQLLHKGQRSTCNICGLSFARRSYVLNHMKTHTQERKFACKFCQATFVRSSARRRHELELHISKGEKKPPRKDTRRNRVRKKKVKVVKEESVPNVPIVTVNVPGHSFEQSLPMFPISGPFKSEEEMLRYE